MLVLEAIKIHFWLVRERRWRLRYSKLEKKKRGKVGPGRSSINLSLSKHTLQYLGSIVSAYRIREGFRDLF
jgi:hypothetical protein